jgi:dual specificity protein kinase YAK1
MDRQKDSNDTSRSSQSRLPPSQSSNIQISSQPLGVGTPPQSLIIDENNALLSSIVYDRTIKVPKTNYADHGSHGVAAVPTYNQLGGDGNSTSGVSGVGGVDVTVDARHRSDDVVYTSTLPSSVQMALQMQQMVYQQQQSSQHNNHNMRQSNSIRQNIPSHQQQRQQQYQIMPPQSYVAGNMGSGYSASLIGNNAVLPQDQHNGQTISSDYSSALMGGSGGPHMWGERLSLSNAGGSIANATSSTTLMHALNAQMAANQAAINLMNSHAALLANEENGAVGGDYADLSRGNPVATGLGYMNNINSQQQQFANIGPSVNSQFPDTTISPGGTRYGKKRVSPSIPLHPSQLVGGVLAGGSYIGAITVENNSGGMKSVAEEGEELVSNDSSINGQMMNMHQPQQVLNSSSTAVAGVVVSQVDVPHGLLSAMLGQGLPQSLEQSHIQSNQSSLGNDEPSSSFSPNEVAADDLKTSKSRHGEVLTNPSIPSADSPLDNVEGNLIVRRGDLLRIPLKNVHYHPPSTSTRPSVTNSTDNKEGHVEYRVISLLGQGTFAQVFHCTDQKTKKCVAVKIVKNKPAYTRQAAVEIDVFRKLNSPLDGEEYTTEDTEVGGTDLSTATATSAGISFGKSSSTTSTVINNQSTIRLISYFTHSAHLCLVFEMLGPNLYELLKKRQFCGLPLGAVRSLVRQATEGVKLLCKKNVVHCDLKPENILMVRSDVESVITECKRRGDALSSSRNIDTRRIGDNATSKSAQPHFNTMADSEEDEEQWIKLIDFGSACFEGQATHTYIQSRFYRSPEVLIGLPYDSAIDIWSLGCVAAELFLGLPILPGVHEHDQLGRVLEMIGPMPDWMLEQGSKSGKFFNNLLPLKKTESSPSRSSWEFKTRQEYIRVLSEEEIRSKGGLSKLEQQHTNRYFKKTRLDDIVMHHGVCNTTKEREQLCLFVHFLKGVLEIDPWKRWTAHQASMHPFLTGGSVYRIKASSVGGVGVKPCDIQWVPPWDASISKRKLVVLQKTKEKAAHQAQVANSSRGGRNAKRNSFSEVSVAGSRIPISQSVPEASALVPIMQLPQLATQSYGSPLKTKTNLEPPSPTSSVASQMAGMADAMSLERALSNISGEASPPQTLISGKAIYTTYPSTLSASWGGVEMPLSNQQLVDIGAPGQLHLVGRSFSDNMYHHQQIAQQQAQASLSSLYDAALLQQPPPPHTFMGAQSFSGAYYQGMPSGHHPYVESDLGYALQRPGVVPGMGSDAFAAFQRQSSSSSAAFLAHQSQLSNASLNSLSSSTPRNYGLPACSDMNYQNVNSPGGIILQKLGLQEQMLGNQSNFNLDTRMGLLGQQLDEYSHQQTFLSGGNVHNASSGMSDPASYRSGYDVTSVSTPLLQGTLPYNTHNTGFNDSSSGWQQHQNIAPHYSRIHSGSYHGGYDATSASLPYNIHSASFSDFGSTMQLQHQNLAQVHPPIRRIQSNGYDQILYPHGSERNGKNSNTGKSNH